MRIVYKLSFFVRNFKKMKRLKNSIGNIFRKKKSVSTQTDLAVVDGEKMNITSVQLGKVNLIVQNFDHI